MHILWTIIKREYFNIVRKKAFLLSTFLLPLGIGLIFGIQIAAALLVEEETYTVWLRSEDIPEDFPMFNSRDGLTFALTTLSEDSLRNRILSGEGELYVRLPGQENLDRSNGTLTIFGASNISEQVHSTIRRQAEDAIAVYKRERAGISEATIKSLEYKLDVQTRKWTGEGTRVTHTEVAGMLGFLISILIYMMMSIYGSTLMQGVIEEKTNRIVEVIVSSVKPFRLLLGKILAIAAVGITQMLLWGLLSGLVLLLLSPLASLIDPSTISQPGMEVQDPTAMVDEIMAAVGTFNWNVLWFFPVYFLGGFFLYGSLMAAAGSAVDNVQDAQQFLFPVMIPMILPLLFMFNIIQNPNSSFAVFASLFPFFSPMGMMIRVSLTSVPWYEILFSILLLIGTFLFCVWVAARIYRVGILMYGKKPSFRELIKWIRY